MNNILRKAKELSQSREYVSYVAALAAPLPAGDATAADAWLRRLAMPHEVRPPRPHR
jgi:hypothetical protein